MDVEKTIEFILQSQAKAEARSLRADQRMDRADQRMDRFEKKLEATRRLVERGMQMLVKSNKDLQEKINALIHSQQITEKKLQRFLDSQLRRNGR